MSAGRLSLGNLVNPKHLNSIGTECGPLKERVATLGTKITVVYIDNCCQLAKLIREVLGEDVEIKLDPLHAIQRLVTTIPKSHPYIASRFQTKPARS